MEQPKNPYVIGNSVGDSPAFVGRDDVLREVLNVVHHDNQNAIVLFGQRRIGKTSVLRELEARLPKEGDFLPVFFDLQSNAGKPLGEVLQELARKISDNLSNVDLNLVSPLENNFQVWLVNIIEKFFQQQKLVLLLDEFDTLNSSKQEATNFFIYLRELLDKLEKKSVNIVFAVGRNATDLNEIAGSLFKSIISQRVSLLKKDDTLKLIHLAENNIHWTEDAIEHIWQQTNGHPFITQCLCYTLWNTAYTNKPKQVPEITLNDVNQAIPDTLGKSESAFEWLWDGLGPAEQLVAAALASAGAEPKDETQLKQLLHDSGVRIVIQELKNAPKILQDWDLIEPTKAGYRFRVELLRQWIANNKPLEQMQGKLDALDQGADELYKVAENFYKSYRFEDAIDTFRQVIKIYPNHVKAHTSLADVLIKRQQYKKAQDILEKLYNFNPVAAKEQLIDVLLILAKSGDIKEQRRYYKRISEINPEHPEAQQKLQELSGPSREQPLPNDENHSTDSGQSPALKKMQAELRELEREQAEKEKEFSRNQPPKPRKKPLPKQPPQPHHLKNNLLKFFQWAFIFCLALVASYFLYNYFIPIPKDTVILEVETDGTSTYSLTGAGSDKSYSFESMTIWLLSSHVAKQAAFRYDGQPIELTKNIGANAYTVSKTLLQQALGKDSHFVFEFLDKNRFVFSFEFENLKTNLDFNCQIATSDNQNVPHCKIREQGYLSLFYGIPWWGLGSIVGVLLIFLIELRLTRKNWKEDDKF